MFKEAVESIFPYFSTDKRVRKISIIAQLIALSWTAFNVYKEMNPSPEAVEVITVCKVEKDPDGALTFTCSPINHSNRPVCEIVSDDLHVDTCNK
jgi:hypothetical protein